MGARATDETSGIPPKVWSSAGWLIAGRLFGSACTVVTLLVLSGHLAESEFGVLAFWLAAFLVLDGIVDFGAGQTAVQLSSRRPDSLASVLITARRSRIAVAILVALGVAAAGIGLEGEQGWFLAAAGLYQVSHVLELSTIGWRNAIAWRSPVLVRAGASAASLAFVLLLRTTGETRPLAYLLAIACGSTLGNVGLHLMGRRGLPSTRGATPAPLGPFLAASIPIGAAAVCQQLYFHVDNVFVRALQGDEAVGHYGVAVRVMSLSIMGGVFVAGAALPWLARCHGRGEILPAVARLTAATGVGGAIVAGVLFPLRTQILSAFGSGFPAASPALAWLLVAGFLVHLGAPLLTAVVARGDGPKVLGIAGAGLALNLLGNGLLTPTWGMVGAAASTVATEAWVVAASLLVLLEGRPGALSSGSPIEREPSDPQSPAVAGPSD